MTDRGAPDTALSSGSFRARWGAWLAYLGAWLVFLIGEYVAVQPELSVGGIAQWLLAADPETLVLLGLLLLAIPAWRLHADRHTSRATDKSSRQAGWLARLASGERGSSGRGIIFSLIVAGVSLTSSARIGEHFDRLPPAYHDEYSYLFQAQTFLAGRVSFPSHEASRLFDQMHVLNEGRFASRYFPGTGIWMAPFVALGNPWWGHWLAGAITAVLVFWIGRELAGDVAGLIAGLLTALAPGMALFSNLLLAHQPTLVGLSLFLLGYLRAIRTGDIRWGLAAGAGLCFAALCRPMTAAGVAFPFGAHLVFWAATGRGGEPHGFDRRTRLRLLLAVGAPLLVGGVLQFAYDRAITGNGLVTPYGLYTELHTPRHVYGFNNVVRGEQHLGPRVIENYDRWAENLTPRLAARNVRDRWIASWQWTLGLIPLTMALVAGLAWWPEITWGTRLVFGGILSLHAAHIPYWFVGMHNFHYVFESGPLWLLWVGAVSVQGFRLWDSEGRRGLAVWWLTLLIVSVTINDVVRSGLWSTPLDAGIAEVRFAREKYGRFRNVIASGVHPRPALVLIDEDPADRHLDYVVNDPALQNEVLFARDLPAIVPLAEVQRLFPDRALFRYHVASGELTRLPGGAGGR